MSDIAFILFTAGALLLLLSLSFVIFAIKGNCRPERAFLLFKMGAAIAGVIVSPVILISIIIYLFSKQ